MIFLSAFGFDIVELGPNDFDETYNVLAEELVRRNLNPSLVARDERILRNNINFTFKTNLYYAVGLKKDDLLVGVCLCNDSDDMPWIGNLVISTPYRKTKAVVVLMHFMLNMIFKDRNVSTGEKNTEQFKKHLLPSTRELQFRVFDPRSAERFQKIIDKASE